jgi:hypothetical protein
MDTAKRACKIKFIPELQKTASRKGRDGRKVSETSAAFEAKGGILS